MDWGSAEDVTSNKFRFVEGDILFGKIRPYFHKVGFALTDGITSSDTIVDASVTWNKTRVTLRELFATDTCTAVRMQCGEGLGDNRRDSSPQKRGSE